MLCDQCHERDVVLNLTQIVENAVTQLHLCEKCAAERGIETTVSMPKHPLGDFLDAVQQQAREVFSERQAAVVAASIQQVQFNLAWAAAVKDAANPANAGVAPAH